MSIPLEQHIGQWALIPLEFSFESTDSAADLARRGADAATVAVLLATIPWPGYVAAISVNAVGGNLADAVFLIQVNGSAVAASSFNPGAAAAGRQSYKNTDVPFTVGQTLAVEIDSLTTLRDCVVTLWVAVNLAS